MKKYIVRPGYSLSTKVGMAHCGAIIDKKYFTREDAEKYLDALADEGKIEYLDGKEDDKKLDDKKSIFSSSKNKDKQKEEKVEEQKEEKVEEQKDDKKELFGGASRK